MKVRCPNCNGALPYFSLGDHFACQHCGERLRSSLGLPLVVFLVVYALAQLLWSRLTLTFFAAGDGLSPFVNVAFSAILGLGLFIVVFALLAGRVVRY